MKRILFLTIAAIVLTACASCAPIDSTNMATTPNQVAILETTAITVIPTLTATPKVITQVTPTREKVAAIDYTAPEKWDTNTMNYFRSDEYAKLVQERDAAGLYPDFPSSAVPFEKGTVVNFSQSGWKGPRVMNDYVLTDAQITLYKIPKNRPFQTVEGHRVVLENGKTAYFMLIRVLNPDGTHGFIGDEKILGPSDEAKGIGPVLNVSFGLGDPSHLFTLGWDTLNTSWCEKTLEQYGIVGLPETCGEQAVAVISAKPIANGWISSGNLKNEVKMLDGSTKFVIPTTIGWNVTIPFSPTRKP